MPAALVLVGIQSYVMIGYTYMYLNLSWNGSIYYILRTIYVGIIGCVTPCTHVGGKFG